MFQFVTQHQFWTAVAVYWIFSAAVSAMPEPSPYRARASRPEPEPGPNTGPGYLWLYRFLHTIAGNLTTAFGNRVPGLKTLVLLFLPIVLMASGCAPRYTVHPGALNATDSVAYDTLLIAQAAIDQARVENQTRPLSGDAKDAFNTLVRSYNVAREAWLTYRAAIAADSPSDQYFQQLTTNLADLANAIEALKQKGVKQ
jgi:hypothetical protein